MSHRHPRDAMHALHDIQDNGVLSGHRTSPTWKPALEDAKNGLKGVESPKEDVKIMFCRKKWKMNFEFGIAILLIPS